MSNSLPLSVQMRIEEVCTRFEGAWKAAGPTAGAPPIENYLGETEGPQRSALLRELLRLGLHYRGQLGEAPCAEDYEARFPEDAEAIRTLLAALPAVSSLPGRVAPPAGEPGRATVRPGPAAETVADPGRTGPAEAPGQADAAKTYPTIPGYEIEGELGRGGMGVVYKARQTALKRPAARPGDEDQRVQALRRLLGGARQLLADHRAHAAGHEGEVGDADDDRPAADVPVASAPRLPGSPRLPKDYHNRRGRQRQGLFPARAGGFP